MIDRPPAIFALLACLVLAAPSVAEETPTGLIPDEAKAMMSKLVGTWTLKANRNGEVGEELYQAQWNANHAGLELSGYQLDNGSVNKGIGYWDAASKEYVEHWIGGLPSVELRYRRVDDQKWQGTAVVFDTDGERKEGTASVEFGENSFAFTGEAGDVSVHNTNQRITLSQSLTCLESWSEFAVGGTWVSDHARGANRHSYTWRPGGKVLLLDRQGSRYPGLSLITMDYQAQCVRWHEVDDDGMSGSAIFWQVHQDEWRLVGMYGSREDSQVLTLAVKRIGQDEIHVSGKDIINGKSTDISVTWQRERE